MMIECRVVGGGMKKKRRRRREGEEEGEEREWLVNLLGNKYFEACVDHRELRKNEKNVFCIDCNLCFCKHCIISNHCLEFHRRLQICRYVYHDVVRLLHIQKYIDCSNIQTYKINGEKAVHLNPRPPQTQTQCQSQGLIRDAKATKGGSCCLACGRHIQDLPNRFCSIACKVSVVDVIRKDDYMTSYPFPGLSSKEYSQNESTLSSTDISLEEIEASAGSWFLLTPNKKKKKKRKGVPHRAPLC